MLNLQTPVNFSTPVIFWVEAFIISDIGYLNHLAAKCLFD